MASYDGSSLEFSFTVCQPNLKISQVHGITVHRKDFYNFFEKLQFPKLLYTVSVSVYHVVGKSRWRDWP